MKQKGRPDYMNERVFCRNRLPPRAYSLPAETLLLSGRWRFHLTDSPLNEEPETSNAKAWSSINVPGHWELQGYGNPWYTNINYPFPVDPPHVPSHNPTGIYETTFTIPEDWNCHGGFDYRLRFEGVDSAYHLFVDGTEMGYAQGSRNPAEFDISHIVASGKNKAHTLRVKVYKWSDGSYIEDQDMWWLSGIFRDVYLLGFPKKAHIEDFFIRTKFDDKLENAKIEVDVSPVLDFAVELRLKLTGLNGDSAAPLRIFELGPNNNTVTCSLDVPKPRKWTAESPNLYNLSLTISANKTIFQEINQRIGFRTIEIKKGLLHVNNVPILLKGVNRHDHHPRFGRAVPLEFVRHDLIQMKQHNINALRCSHYPDDPRLVSIADELGIYVIDEADLECHGMSVDWSKLPSSTPSWKDAYVDRMHQLVHRDKNHPSVIIWSLGNEAYYGENHQAMYDWSKSYDKTRPVHYENDHEFRASDICSYMYLSVDDLAKQATQDGDDYEKPIILQEYLHAMGNGPGNAEEYMKTFRKHRRLQGGFVWEWANHGILKPLDDGSGNSYYAYGGDFGDEPNDGNFVMDGLCDSEHMPGPGLVEMKSAYQPVSLRLEAIGDKIGVSVQNLFDFKNLDDLEYFWTISNFGYGGREDIIESQRSSLAGIKPSKRKTVLSVSSKSWKSSIPSSETWLSVSLRTSTKSLWAPAGHEIAFADFCLDIRPLPDLSIPRSVQGFEIKKTNRTIRLNTTNCVIIFDVIEARLKEWKYQGQDVLSSGQGPQLTFWRAPTDNDSGGAGQLGDWQNHRLHELTQEVRSVQHSVDRESGALKIVVESYIAPPSLAWGFETRTEYAVSGHGKILITVHTSRKGDAPGTIPRVGLEMSLPEEQTHCQWLGLGPEQTYRDMKSAGKIGVWRRPLKKMSHMYEMPQETGNHTETRWVQVTDEQGTGIKAVLVNEDFGSTQIHPVLKKLEDAKVDLSDKEDASKTSPIESWEHIHSQSEFQQSSDSRTGFDFAVSKYTAQELTRAQHPYELRENDGVVFRVDADHHGLGSASCGPDVLDKYKLKTKDFNFTVSLEPVRG